VISFHDYCLVALGDNLTIPRCSNHRNSFAFAGFALTLADQTPVFDVMAIFTLNRKSRALYTLPMPTTKRSDVLHRTVIVAAMGSLSLR
jgi:hypothetical protein